MCIPRVLLFLFFFFNDTAPTEIYTLSLHDALPILPCLFGAFSRNFVMPANKTDHGSFANQPRLDRKSTRLNSSHMSISYAVFCLKKKKAQYERSISESVEASRG